MWHVWWYIAAGLGVEAKKGDGRLQLRTEHIVQALLGGHRVHMDVLQNVKTSGAEELALALAIV